MYIEFPLPINYRVRQLAIPKLHKEIRQWAFTHNIDYSIANVQYSNDNNTERLYLHSDRATELFCISWNPMNSDFNKFSIRKDV